MTILNNLLNNPLFLVAVSAGISALITAAIETAITNRQKATFDQRLEEVQHKHALEVEQLKYENASQLEKEASQLRLEYEHDRSAAEQRLVKLPKAIAAAYKLRYLFFDLLNELSDEHEVTSAQLRNYVESVYALSDELLQIDDPEIREEAHTLVSLCEIGPSELMRFYVKVDGGDEEAKEWHDSLVGNMRERYEEIKEAQKHMLALLEKSDGRPRQK